MDDINITEDSLSMNNEETSYLSSIPGYVDDIKKIDKEENWEEAEEYKQKELD